MIKKNLYNYLILGFLCLLAVGYWLVSDAINTEITTAGQTYVKPAIKSEIKELIPKKSARNNSSNAANLDFYRLMPSYADTVYTDDFTQLKQRKVIRALVVPSRTDFYIDNGKISGFIVKLLDNYENELNKGVTQEDKKTRIVYVPVDFNDLIPYLLAGKGDIAAGLLTATDSRKKQVDFVASHRKDINEVIITNRSSNQNLVEMADLSGKDIYIVKGSSYFEHLSQFNIKLINKGLKPINIIEAEDYLSSEDILEMLNAGAIEFTVIDDFRANLWAKVLPNIQVRNDLILNESGSVGWAVRKNNPELKQHLKVFSKQVKKGTLLGNIIINQYYGRDQKLENLKQYKESDQYKQLMALFKKYGRKYDIDYLKLIAQAYQESGLRQDVTSHRGAVGVMQLMPSTAKDKHVAIENIERLENNIHAGAKYMNFLRSRYFNSPNISREDQIFFSWAAYNAGPANVRKMRSNAEKMGLDKNVWFQNVEVAAGRLIGSETVRYVANIYKYYSTYMLLDKKEN